MSGVMNSFRNFIGLGNDTPAPNPHVEGNNTIPNGNTMNSDGTPVSIPKVEPEASPLDSYKDLFLKDPKAPQPVSATPNLAIDPAKLAEAAKGLDFTKGIDPELLRKASSGDTEALSSALNAAAQAGFSHNTNIMTTVVQKALETQAKTFEDTIIPDILRKYNVASGIREGNPIYNNPAVSPIIAMLENSLVTKYPTASPSEIRKHAEDYMGGFIEAVAEGTGRTVSKKSETSSETSGRKSGEDIDWMEFVTRQS